MLQKQGIPTEGVLYQVLEELQKLNAVYRKENEEMVK
jgi:hypothetical protein